MWPWSMQSSSDFVAVTRPYQQLRLKTIEKRGFSASSAVFSSFSNNNIWKRQVSHLSTIRIFTSKDAEAVSELNKIAFINDPTPPPEFYVETFLNNPWFDESIPPLVHVEKDGRVTGFLGVVPRDIEYGLIKGRAAIVCQLMVDPKHRSSMAGLRLLKKHFTGSQLISISDSANESGRKIWTALGGEIVPSYSLSWQRYIGVRLATRIAKRLGRSKGLGFLGKAALPLASLIDRAIDSIVYRSRQKFEPTELICKDLRVTGLEELATGYSSNLMNFRYADTTLTIMLQRARPSYRASDTVKVKGIFDTNQNLLGLAVYFISGPKEVHVLHYVSLPGRAEDVLNCFSSCLDREGVRSVRGRMNPQLIRSFGQIEDLNYSHRRLWSVVFSKDQSLLSAVWRGDIVLSIIECEWSCNYRA